MAERFLRSVHDAVSREYDYVIVGGGLPHVYQRIPSLRARSEAGRANLNDDSITMPGTFGKNFFQPDYEWGFMTVGTSLSHGDALLTLFPDLRSQVPQKHSSDTVFYWPRGKGLGGSSCINFYVFAQPPASDIDARKSRVELETYMRYSRKSESFNPPSAQEAAAERLHFNPAHHGTDGPISSCYAPLRSGWDTLYQDTLGNLGLPPTKDSVLGDGNGAWMATCSVNPDTKRRSTAVEYLHQASARENLHVVVSSPVTKILFKDEKTAAGDVVASGVEFVHDGKTYTARAKREVILSSGALKSPQILELSGIGNPEVLAKIGVKPKIDLPNVGENVQEHVFTNLAFELKNPEKYNTQEPLADEAVLKDQLGLYNSGDKSLFLLSFLGMGSGSVDRLSPNGAALIASHVARIRATSPDTWRPGVAEQYALQVDKLNAGTASTSIHAVSPDPLAPPALDPHYYEDDFDIQTIVELTKFVRRLGKTAPLGDIIAREHNPGPEVQTDEELIAWIKQTTNSIARIYVGDLLDAPARQGRGRDPRLKVYGTHNLRVVDLSILPLHIGAPTQVYVYGMAEQGKGDSEQYFFLLRN
ncbi:GMC oxidoreductase-domain-containing protein [Russula vinacea]|nr:GMC oxidoreductase-domain-containing protein [Russula vinacea]